jgi:hypothetical protein
LPAKLRNVFEIANNICVHLSLAAEKHGLSEPACFFMGKYLVVPKKKLTFAAVKDKREHIEDSDLRRQSGFFLFCQLKETPKII